MPQKRKQSHDHRVADETQKEKQRPKKGKKVHLMEASGQTDGERRKLRQDLRKLGKFIEQHAEEMENPEMETLEGVRDQSNMLFDKVRFTREAVLDSENLDTITTKASRQLDKLVEVPRYDPLRLIEKLRSKCAHPNGSFDWVTLSHQAGACFNAIPSKVRFLSGPLKVDYTPVQRQRAARRPKPSNDEEEEDEEEEQEAKTMKKPPPSENHLSAVERHIVDLTSVLKKECRQKQRQDLEEIERLPEEEKQAKRERIAEVSLVSTLWNPQSFTQTVENLFHTSFLVKKGGAQLEMREDGPTIKLLRSSPSDDEKLDPPRQAILRLTMQNWRDLRDGCQVTRPRVPHRPTPKG